MTATRIPFISLKPGEDAAAVDAAIRRVIDRGWFVLGPEVEAFEGAFANASGAAYGVGVSLGTTVIFLMLVQLTQAVGGKGLVNPELAAWLPGILFLAVGAALLARVRT